MTHRPLRPEAATLLREIDPSLVCIFEGAQRANMPDAEASGVIVEIITNEQQDRIDDLLREVQRLGAIVGSQTEALRSLSIWPRDSTLEHARAHALRELVKNRSTR